MRRVRPCGVVVALAVSMLAGPLPAAVARAAEPIVIGERVTIHSRVLDEERTLLVHLPPDYHASKTGYHVLYLLDGEYHFHHIAGVTDFLAMWEEIPQVAHIPPLIVVGVVNTDRRRDLLPALVDDGDYSAYVPAGPSARFLRFLTEELIPHVDGSYRTLPFRILAGHCAGGLFALHTLLAEPEAFDAYIAISPYLTGDPELPLAYVPHVLARSPGLDSFLFVSVGDEPEPRVATVQRLVDILDRAAPGGLRWMHRRYSDAGHGGDVHKSVYDALQALYAGWRLPGEALNQGPEVVEEHFEALRERWGYLVGAPEGVRNELGYRLLEQRRVAEAIEVFRRNVEAYPDSANTHDSLGEALMAAGETEQAIASYERSLELDPHNGNAVRMLERLRGE